MILTLTGLLRWQRMATEASSWVGEITTIFPRKSALEAGLESGEI